MRQLLVRNCSQLVTLAGPRRARTGPEMRELSVIRDGALLVEGDRIEAVGTREEVEARVDGKEGPLVVDAGGRLVMPGFVDAHTHPIFAGTRADEYEERLTGTSYQQIAERGGGIRSTVRKTREADEDALLAAGRRYSEWFLAGGTTTIEAKSGYGLSLEAEFKILRVIRRLGELGRIRTVATFLGAHEIPDEFRGRAEEYLDLVIGEMLPRVATEKLAEYCDVFCEPAVFPVAQARRLLREAQRSGLGLRMHADQFTPDEGALLAAELRCATADHLECTGPKGLAALKDAGVQPVLLPASVYALGGHRYPAARNMIDAGLAVILASDFNPGSSPTASMPMVLSLATSQMRMTAAECITAATVNAAWSLGRGNEIGSLEPGKAADFVIHDSADYREVPYFFGREPAWSVFIGGNCAYAKSGASTRDPHPA